MAGNNNEHIDVYGVSRTIEAATAPTVPHIIMISTERSQSPAAGVCGPLYRAFVTVSRQAATAGSAGSIRVIDGDHDLYVTHLAQVVKAIDAVSISASIRRCTSALNFGGTKRSHRSSPVIGSPGTSYNF